MRVVLGTFACNGIEALLGRDIAAGVQTALRHYTRRDRAERAREANAFLSIPGYSADRSGADLELTVEPEIEAALKREARESGGAVEELVVHAVLVYLADLDKASKLLPRPLTQV